MMKRGYVICGYARTGGTLLSRALRATGVLGYPQEYFNPPAVDAIAGAPYPSDRAAQCAQIAHRGTSPNGVYGLKVFADQFDAMAGFDWIAALPELNFIHLERRDALGQALSHVRALQTGQWTGEQAIWAEPRYDAAAIHAALALCAAERARWQMFFARNGLAPLWLTYEDVIADLAGAVRQIAEHVGVVLPVSLPHLETLPRQADAISDAWRARFLAEERDLTRLDRLEGAGMPLASGLTGKTRLRGRLARLVKRGGRSFLRQSGREVP